jgi:DEAD/DEAH box helicase domain-containing protein
VADLDLDGRTAVVKPDDGSTYTVARTDIDIRIVHRDAMRPLGHLEVGLGTVEVHEQVIGYQRKDALTGESLGMTALELPRSTLCTRAFWYLVPEHLLARAGVAMADGPGALHAAEHAGIGVLPLFTICDRWDVGGVSTLHQTDLGAPAIVIYDGYQGGAGIADLGYEAAPRHLATTAEIIESCPCVGGCPSCVQSPKCGNGNEPLDKAGALALLRAAL